MKQLDVPTSIPGTWRGRRIADIDACPTGYAALDALLPGHGWPISAVTELAPLAEGIGELRLLLPTLRQLITNGRNITLVRPPHLPYPLALARAGLPPDRLTWIHPKDDEEARKVAEHTLLDGIAGAVLLWTSTDQDIALRRLRIAAEESHALLFTYRPYASLRSRSPAAVRLVLHPSAGAMRVEIIKAKGGRAGRSALCSLKDAA